MKNTYACVLCGEKESHVVVSGIRDWEYGFPGEFEHRRCARCGVVQLHPFPELPELIQAYEVDYHGYASAGDKGPLYQLLYKAGDAALRRHLGRHLRPGAKVLDVGCGSGEMLARLRALGIEDLNGIDFSERAVALARDRGINAYRGTFADYPAEPQSHDALFMNNYLEHTLDPAAELRKARDLLRPGGMLFGEVPNFDSVDRALFGRFWGGNHAPRHTFQFSPGTLAAQLRAAGFTDVRVRQQLNTTHFALSLQNWIEHLRGGSSRLRHGRASYYGLLLLLLIPVNLICALLGRSGVMKFEARVPLAPGDEKGKDRGPRLVMMQVAPDQPAGI
jgi:SAM-dependent methyltransferase